MMKEKSFSQDVSSITIEKNNFQEGILYAVFN